MWCGESDCSVLYYKEISRGGVKVQRAEAQRVDMRKRWSGWSVSERVSEGSYGRLDNITTRPSVRIGICGAPAVGVRRSGTGASH